MESKRCEIPHTWLSINMALPTVGVDWLDAMRMAAAAAAEGAIISRGIYNRE
jgi:hypothetical protein